MVLHAHISLGGWIVGQLVATFLRHILTPSQSIKCMFCRHPKRRALIVINMLWNENTSLNCDHQRAYCSSPRLNISVENHGGMILAGEYSWFVHQSSCSPTSSHLVARQEELGEGSYEFGLTKYLCACFEGIFNMPKCLTTCCRRASHYTTEDDKGTEWAKFRTKQHFGGIAATTAVTLSCR
jgi:hypothetical protein